MNLKSIFVFLLVLPAACFGAKESEQSIQAKQPKTYGNAEVAKIIQVNKALSFHCNIKGWPAVIGENIKVKIDGIQPIQNKEKQSPQNRKKPSKAANTRIKEFVKSTLTGAESIQLKNIKRGRRFCILADVVVDGKNLAEVLIQKHLAQPYKAQKPSDVKPHKSKKTDTSAAAALDKSEKTTKTDTPVKLKYVASKNSKVFHLATCSHAARIATQNQVSFDARDQAVQTGRRPCKTCQP